MPDAQPKPTAAEVLAAHYGSLWCPTCGPNSATNDDGDWKWDVTQHQADMLAAAGLLTTAEHDAQVLRDARSELLAGDNPWRIDERGAEFVAAEMDAMIARVAAGEEP